MTEILYVTEVEPLEGHRIRATCSDGAVKDLGELLAAGGVFTPICERRELFERVRVNPDSRTVEWPGEVDLDPEVRTAATSRRRVIAARAGLFGGPSAPLRRGSRSLSATTGFRSP